MKSFLIIVLASISCANVHSFHVSDDSDVIDNSGRMLLESVGPVLRGEIAAPGPCVGGSCSAPMITAGAGIISASYPVRPRIQYAPAMSYGQVVESKHVKISVREESQILRRGLNFIKIVWGLISLLPKSVIRHGLFIPMKIARFIHVIGSTLLQNIENTIESRISFWKDDVVDGIKKNFIKDFKSVRNVLRELLLWIAKGLDLCSKSHSPPEVQLPEMVYEPVMVQLKSLTKGLE
ncbi:Hypothetical protein NTJ_12594 [Nesidiocoris tenuis]|uniref:Uncharacterized protein n=1 Tax=Nesidiocoris tenuis TaxID=355587 RepID=A0ABN7B5U7_9HEMI|nr:Hypothetical protein NTJ_12594 [Nesidiocoris tenuis]